MVFENSITTTGIEFTLKDLEFFGEIIKLKTWIISDDTELFLSMLKERLGEEIEEDLRSVEVKSD